jgi:hypothetical protein
VPTLTRAATAGVLALVLLTGCGSNAKPAASASSATPSAAAVPSGNWLLRFNTAEGADGEVSRAVYVSYDPDTGKATVRRMPAVVAGDAYGGGQALLISADHAWSLTDTTVGREGARGVLTLYAVTGKASWTLPLRSWTHTAVRPIAAAFDPSSADLLRVVDATRRVWKIDLSERTASPDGRLARRTGWIYGNGFDKNSGAPYIEAIDSEKTLPPGNGDNDVRPVVRQGGSLLSPDGSDLPGLPKLPCGFAGGFTASDGSSWIFCADTPSISAYRVEAGGTAWKPYGTPSVNVIPGVASELAVVLPPVS